MSLALHPGGGESLMPLVEEESVPDFLPPPRRVVSKGVVGGRPEKPTPPRIRSPWSSVARAFQNFVSSNSSWNPVDQPPF